MPMHTELLGANEYWALTGASGYWAFWGVPMKIGLWILIEMNLGWCQWILVFEWKKLLLQHLETLKHKNDARCMNDMLGCAIMDAIWC
jgi:hypothetical protein